MNIFATDTCPVKSAYNLDIRRVNKLIMESAQMLCNALRKNGFSSDELCKAGHYNHPCTNWTASTRSNFDWLVAHAFALEQAKNEYYGNTRSHGHMDYVRYIFNNGLRKNIPEGSLEPFARAYDPSKIGLGNYLRLKEMPSITDSYREYLKLRWKIEIDNTKDKYVPAWVTKPSWANT